MPETATEERDEQQRRETAARRLRVSLAVGIVGLAVAATAALVATHVDLGTPPPRERTPPPVRLDTLRSSGDRRGLEAAEPGSAEVTKVIGVGTERFSAHSGHAPVVDVDGIAKDADVPSDAEVKRQLAALERANERIERQLSGLGGPGIGTGDLIWPVRGPVTSGFGPRWGRLHAGMDIAVPTGTAVHAADSGTVVVSGWVGGYGNYICIRHTRSLTTCYAHNQRLLVAKGDRVRKGAVIARANCTGSCTGPHVHFETRVNGRPVDPRRFL